LQIIANQIIPPTKSAEFDGKNRHKSAEEAKSRTFAFVTGSIMLRSHTMKSLKVLQTHA